MAAEHEAGYATPAAAVISFAIAAVVAATTARTLSELRLAKADLAHTQVEYALDAAHNAALLAISTSSRPPPYRWTMPSLGDTVRVVAEPERFKLNPAAAAMLDDAQLAALGGDAPDLRGRLEQLRQTAALVWIADQAVSERWKACAASYVSTFGVGARLHDIAYAEPQAGQQPGLWRAGEVWRIEITDKAGWRDERIVRLTGDSLDPAAVIGRRLTRGGKGQHKCEALFEDASSA